MTVSEELNHSKETLSCAGHEHLPQRGVRPSTSTFGSGIITSCWRVSCHIRKLSGEDNRKVYLKHVDMKVTKWNLYDLQIPKQVQIIPTLDWNTSSNQRQHQVWGSAFQSGWAVNIKPGGTNVNHFNHLQWTQWDGPFIYMSIMKTKMKPWAPNSDTGGVDVQTLSHTVGEDGKI